MKELLARLPLTYRSAQYLLAAHECLWCALHFILCLQTEFFCLSKAFTTLDTKQTDVVSNTMNLNYSGTQAILLSLSFSHPPSRCRGFNPVMSVSGTLLGPCPKAAGSAPGACGGGQAAAVGDPRRNPPGRPGPARRLPPPPLGRAPGPGPDATLVLRHPRAHCTETSEHPPEQPKGMGSSQRADYPRVHGGSAAAAPGTRLQPVLTTQHNRTQHNTTSSLPAPPSLPPNSRNSWVHHNHQQFFGHHGAYKSNVK